MENPSTVRPRSRRPWRFSLRALLLAMLFLLLVIGYYQARQHRATQIVANYALVVETCDNALQSPFPGTTPLPQTTTTALAGPLSLTEIEVQQMRANLFSGGRTNMKKRVAMRFKLSDDLASDAVSRGVSTSQNLLEHFRSGFDDAGIETLEGSTTPFHRGVTSQGKYATSGNRIIVLTDVFLQPQNMYVDVRITAIDAQELGRFPW